ncbi:MAG: hypothetical protein JNM14_09175 [Ferruginibacter sp.]|nr:hypothetical protein [Ferruginibacter sp.]
MKMHSLLFILAAIVIMPACKKSKTTPASNLNQWDGRYRMEGTMTDHTNPAFGWMNNTYEYSLHTSGTNTDSVVSKTLNFPGIVIGNTGGGITNATYYSKFGLIMTFDAATNKVTAVTNYYGQPSSNGRSAVLDPSGFNDVNPTTKNIRVKFFMDETGVAGHRATFDVTLVYLGAR